MNTYVEKYSSYKKQLINISNSIEYLEIQLKESERKILLHNSFSLDENMKKLNIIRNNISEFDNSLKINTREKEIKSKEIICLDEKIKKLVKNSSLFPYIIHSIFSNDLSDEHTALRKSKETKSAEIKKLEEKISNLESKRETLKKEEEYFDIKIQNHNNFNKNSEYENIESLKSKILTLKNNKNDTKLTLQKLDLYAGVHISEYFKLKSQISSLEEEIRSAESIDRDLTRASNSYERALLHEKCEKQFGNGRPSSVINDRKKHIHSIERSIIKLEKRIDDEMKKSSREIDHIIIDGNNMCYERNNFIQLRAISALLKSLPKNMKKIVVFDASIRKLMKVNDQDLSNYFGENAEIYVTPTKTSADEYILKLSEKYENTYIISNDRYSDFHDYKSIKDGKVIRFMTTSDNIIINDLSVSASF